MRSVSRSVRTSLLLVALYVVFMMVLPRRVAQRSS